MTAAPSTHPMISVIVATRDRGDSVVTTIESILANDYPAVEILVVDQSEGRDTADSVDAFGADSRVRYLQASSLGVSAGRNEGLAAAVGALVAITDDDCRVPTGWLRSLHEAFLVEARIGVVFGNVVPVPHDPATSFIPGYVRDEPFLARHPWQKVDVEGLSACMGIRRTTWERLGGFDPLLGVGGPLRSGAEGDFALRALRAGDYVYETPTFEVVHDGLRRGEEVDTLVRRCWYGTGAMYARHLRRNPFSTTVILGRMTLRFVRGGSRYARHLGPHTRPLTRAASFANGFCAGLVSPWPHERVE